MSTGYLAVILHVFVAALFVQTMRLGQHLRRQMIWVGAVNYLWATCGCAAWWVWRPESRFGADEVIFGAVNWPSGQ